MTSRSTSAPNSTSIYVEALTRAQTPQGLPAIGTIALPWKPDTQTLTIHKVRIIRGDKVIDARADQSFTVLRRETNLERAVLDGSLTAELELEGVQVGDILDMAVTYETRDPAMRGHADIAVNAGFPVPADDHRLHAQWTGPKVIRWRLGDALPAAKLTHQGETTDFDLAMKSVQPVAPPDAAPERFNHAREAQFSDFVSWAEVSALFAPLYAKASILRPDSPLQAEVAKIRAASSDPAAQAAAALALVEDQVRYVYLGMSDGGLTPADADQTWARRFGDCKGKTALLVALLHGLGIQAEPALVSTVAGDGLDARLPTVAVFDHVIVRATVGGKDYWLDGSRSGDAGLALLRVPPYRWALPVESSGSGLVPLVQTASSEADGETRLWLDASAGISQPAPVRAEVVLRGDPAIAAGLQIANLTPEQREQMLRAIGLSSMTLLPSRPLPRPSTGPAPPNGGPWRGLRPWAGMPTRAARASATRPMAPCSVGRPTLNATPGRMPMRLLSSPFRSTK